MKLILIALLTLATSTSFATFSKERTLEGTIAAFDAKTVKLYVEGEFVTVPRTSLRKNVKVAVGQKVTAYLASDANASSADTKAKR